MDQDLADSLLRDAMGGASQDAGFPSELGVLRSLAKYKYDDYQQYSPGRQFIESLAVWLRQFSDHDERRAALDFVSKRLVYVSDLEMRHLVMLMAHHRMPWVLQEHVAGRLNVPPYKVAELRRHHEFRRAMQTSLFLGMSDGARIDQFRRSIPEVSNEQFAGSYELSPQRADKMLAHLHQTQSSNLAVVEHVFLIDDFAGSGTTILRREVDDSWDGRLVRFINETLPKLREGYVPQIVIALYIATQQAVNHLRSLIAEYFAELWPAQRIPQVVTVLTLNCRVRLYHCGLAQVDQLFDRLLHNHYDCTVEDEHKGRVVHGYADCGLPLVLSHNTPNNSVYLLWETEKTDPLFPRVERHHGRKGEE